MPKLHVRESVLITEEHKVDARRNPSTINKGCKSKYFQKIKTKLNFSYQKGEGEEQFLCIELKLPENHCMVFHQDKRQIHLGHV